MTHSSQNSLQISKNIGAENLAPVLIWRRGRKKYRSANIRGNSLPLEVAPDQSGPGHLTKLRPGGRGSNSSLQGWSAIRNFFVGWIFLYLGKLLKVFQKILEWRRNISKILSEDLFVKQFFTSKSLVSHKLSFKLYYNSNLLVFMMIFWNFEAKH